MRRSIVTTRRSTPTLDSGRPPRLRRELGVGGATLLGLGSIVGTGVFVSIGLGAGVVGPAVLPAIVLAGLVALCNALSSAQLAASHPVSGGTYEYGYRYLHPALGFTAGWMFLAAKSASAATAALGFSGYLLHGLGVGSRWMAPVAVVTCLALTAVVATGIRRSNRVNAVVVGVTLASLVVFVVAGLPTLVESADETLTPFVITTLDDSPEEPPQSPLAAFLYATALLFVAYTGYGRVATLGEEVREPRRTIPRAILLTLAVSAALYVAVGAVAVGTLGAGPLYEATRGDAAPLEIAARSFDVPFRIPLVPTLVAVGAMTAMLGVLLNLLLGLSRVVLAMARRADLPAAAARLDPAGTTPRVAVLAVGALVTTLAALGSVETTWSWSAFTVLIYYALTNLAALRLPPQDRLYPRFVSWCGLVACLGLAFWVERSIWLGGLGLLAVGLAWHASRREARRSVRQRGG